MDNNEYMNKVIYFMTQCFLGSSLFGIIQELDVFVC